MKRFVSGVIAIIFLLTCMPVVKAEAASNPYAAWISVFNPDYYMANNAQAAKYAGGNVDRLWQYFIQVGIPKGDQASDEFNVFIYAKNYPELVNAFGGNMIQYYIHYATKGKALGYNAKTIGKANLPGVSDEPAYYSNAYYKAIMEAISQCKEKLILPLNNSGDAAVITKILDDIISREVHTSADANLSGYGIGTRSDGMHIEFMYFDEYTEREAVKRRVAETAPYLAGNNAIETALKVHNYVCDNANYSYGNLNKGSAYDNLILHSSVCTGYAMSFQYYMEYFGIPCYTIYAKEHAWNVIYIDGIWYHVDCTADGDKQATRISNFLTGTERTGYKTVGDNRSIIITISPKSHESVRGM